MPLWFYDLAVWSLQAAILILVGGAMLGATRLRVPRARLICLQILLATALALPMDEPWRIVPQVRWSIPASGPSLEVTGMAPAQVVTVTAPQPHPFPWYLLATFVLLAGVLLRLLWLGAGLARLGRARREALPLGPHEVVEELRSAWGVSAEVLVSRRLASPVTFGWRRPCVILPAGFSRMDAPRQRAIMGHEFLHVRRRDWLWQVGEEVLRALLWFHPAVAWLVGQVRLAREQAVDLEVVAYTGSRREYLNALLEIASAKPHGIPAALFLSERHLKRRVALIVKEVHMARKRMILALSASLAALALAGALVGTLLPLRISASQQQEQREQETKKELGSSYRNWINGPISYIIAPIERVTFDGLRTYQQREAFIDRFWQRRNPNPGSATNRFKEEFYTRVAFANEHFGAAGEPGWRTDRGRIYIMWGPPNQITSPPASGHPPNSVETWIWKYLPGVGQGVTAKFIDRTGEGDYRLTPESNEMLMAPGQPLRLGAPQANEKQGPGPGIVQVGEDAMAARIVRKVQPAYPPLGEYPVQGTVVFDAIIGTDGTVQQLTYVSGPPQLVEPAKKAIEQWRYKPETINGKPVEVETTISLVFTLGGR